MMSRGVRCLHLLLLLLHRITLSHETRLVVTGGPPRAATLRDVAKASASKAFNHERALFFASREDAVDRVVAEGPPPGYKLIHISQRLGRGERVEARARELLTGWRMHDGSATAGIATDGGESSSVVTFARSAPMLWSVNACRVTHQSPHRVGYATLGGTS